jgi:hypothetical protein
VSYVTGQNFFAGDATASDHRYDKAPALAGDLNGQILEGENLG